LIGVFGTGAPSLFCLAFAPTIYTITLAIRTKPPAEDALFYPSRRVTVKVRLAFSRTFFRFSIKRLTAEN